MTFIFYFRVVITSRNEKLGEQRLSLVAGALMFSARDRFDVDFSASI